MTAREALASLPLHERIAAVIDASGLGQDGFADKLGVHRETVNRWVNERSKPSRNARPKISALASEVYGEPVDAGLFRDHAHGSPVGLDEAVRLLSEATSELIGLLAEQRAVVAQLQRIADSLERPANGGNSG